MGLRFNSLTFCSETRITAAAPSLIGEELGAVREPSDLKTGLADLSLPSSRRATSSSTETVTPGLPRAPGSSTGLISALNLPSA
ncbi:hypothetical protein AWJ20_240 [Sugiyamaella lignohabitans]|uniref:Uncharacterized protein n=1 Tax=Sugiyamaella lignohabitans TaxID=796027 RepID=A0A167CR58_9ASCO|nr:uncharacterized protein AWJ20_240 [Sugiyamaella lignohabitans]ANB12009.1 hypothetical protein AWJ20_240 [Sugiyamaella lignohabitans]